MVRILRLLSSCPTDEDSWDSLPITRAQSNVDFVIALFILLVFFSAILFAPGSPLLEAAQAGTDDRIDAQRVAAELSTELGDANGKLNTAEVEAIVDGEEPLDDYTSVSDDYGVNITLWDLSTDGQYGSLFGLNENTRQAGDSTSQVSSWSTAVKTVRIDNRPVRLYVTVWRKA